MRTSLSLDLEELKSRVRNVGDEIVKLYWQKIDTYEKQDLSPVTEADLLSHQLLTQALQKTGIPILSEEGQDDLARLQSDLVWIIDPLDGTLDFIQKTGDFSVMVALAQKGEPIWGVVYAPCRQKLFYAQKGQGAFLELKGKRLKLKASKKDNFEDWTILVSRNHLGKAENDLAEKLNFKQKIPIGSTGIKLSLIAEGKAEIYLHALDKTKEWDIAAAQIILEEAGGKVTDIFGNRLKYNQKNPINSAGVLATNGIKHNQIMAELI